MKDNKIQDLGDRIMITPYQYVEVERRIYDENMKVISSFSSWVGGYFNSYLIKKQKNDRIHSEVNSNSNATLPKERIITNSNEF